MPPPNSNLAPRECGRQRHQASVSRYRTPGKPSGRDGAGVWVGLPTRGVLAPGSPALPTRARRATMKGMNGVEGLLDGVDYHQFYLWGDYPFVPTSYPPGGPNNRLLAATETGHAVCVSTGIAMGMIHLAIEFLDSPPSEVDHSYDWEAVAETSFTATVPTATIVLLMQRTQPPFDRLELPSGADTYRARGHATGRSLDYDIVVDGMSREPREYHLLQLWQADRLEPPVVLREDDPWARQGPPYKTPIGVPSPVEQEVARQIALAEAKRRAGAAGPRPDFPGGTPTRAPSTRTRHAAESDSSQPTRTALALPQPSRKPIGQRTPQDDRRPARRGKRG